MEKENQAAAAENSSQSLPVKGMNERVKTILVNSCISKHRIVVMEGGKTESGSSREFHILPVKGMIMMMKE